VSKIIEKIASTIRAEGAIPFARFMELALYCPDCGFYEKEEDNIGKTGDFFTSVSVGNLFGQLLAFQFDEWFATEAQGQDTELRIVEAGAHNGQLAADILTWLRERRGETFRRLKYYIIEPSERRRKWQQMKLKGFEETVKWLPAISALKSARPSSETIIFSNELLDAMPVHRFGWDASEKKWFEWGVALHGEKFIWTRLENPGFTPPISGLESVLPDGYTVEVSPAAEKWWREASQAFTRGRLVAIDYGFTAEEQFSPARPNGTLRAYRRHQVTDDFLADPGEQDLTAHVNFSTIQKAGEEAGLKTETFCTQPQFLTRIVEKIFKQSALFGEWGPKQTRQFQTLTHPEHLGRAFRVLVQSRQ